MAHMVETMAWAGEKPWHGLGVEVLDDLTPAQMMEKAGLDWSVDKQPLMAKFDNQNVDTGHSALVRSSDGRVLDVISNDWNPVQNEQAFEFFNDFVMEGQMKMNTAGSLDNGRMVWALAKVDDSFTLNSGDRVESYLLFSNPHQYGRCIDIRFTPIRVVCNNTLTLSLQGKTDMMVKLNHRRVFDAEMVKRTLNIASQKMDDYKEAAEFLSQKRYTTDDAHEYLTKLFPVIGDNKRKKELSRPAATIMSVLDTQPGAEMAKDSWWNLFNGVTFATDHLLGNKDDSRLRSAWYGTNRNKKIDALNLAMEMAA